MMVGAGVGRSRPVTGRTSQHRRTRPCCDTFVVATVAELLRYTLALSIASPSYRTGKNEALTKERLSQDASHRHRSRVEH
jgi:hypothetical protein